MKTWYVGFIDVVLTACASLASVLLGIYIANRVNRDWHAQDMEYDMTACNQVGLSNCHIEHIYDGMIWVDYDIIGTREGQ